MEPTAIARPSWHSGLRSGWSCLCPVLALALTAAPPALAQGGRLVRQAVHGRSLEKSVTGESADRQVSVYLPPGYDASPDKRYPTLYLLHGFADTDETWTAGKGPWANLPGLMDRGIAGGRFPAVIVVMPDQRTKAMGSFYRNSAATGNWEDFTAKELVGHVDRTYRTFARAASRGVAGHSMGGHGAIVMGMRHPDVFGVVYGMSPAVLGWGGDLSIGSPAFATALAATDPGQLVQKREQFAVGLVAIAQAFSPNPDRGPFFADLPFAAAGGKLRPADPAFGRWEENFPLNMVKGHRANLARLRGLSFDCGADDEFTHIPVTARALSFTLTNNGIEHTFEEYNGGHRDRLWGSAGRLYTAVLPYFGRMLDPDSK